MYIFDGPYLFEGTLEQRQLFLLVRAITADIYTAVKVTTLSKTLGRRGAFSVVELTTSEFNACRLLGWDHEDCPPY